jgi:hypothetical protein
MRFFAWPLTLLAGVATCRIESAIERSSKELATRRILAMTAAIRVFGLALIVIAAVVALLGSPLLAVTHRPSPPPPDPAIREVVSSFLTAEFTASPHAYVPWALFSPERRHRLRHTDPLTAGLTIVWQDDPIVVVSAFRISPPVHFKDEATVTVRYRRLAVSHGKGDARTLVPHPGIDIVTLHCVRRDDRWFILDPPVPRVSRQALLHYYQATVLSAFPPAWLKRPDITPIQKRYYQRLLDTVTFLQRLTD